MKEGLEGEASEYADRGVAQGYVGGILGNSDTGEGGGEEEGKRGRVEAEKEAEGNAGSGAGGEDEKGQNGTVTGKKQEGGGGGGVPGKQPLQEVSGNVKDKGGQGAKKVTGAANGTVNKVPVAGGGLSSATKGITG